LAPSVEHLERAGFREGVGVGLFGPDGRHLGVLTLHTKTADHPSDAARDFLGRLASRVDPRHRVNTLDILRNRE
jgi:hypothetical protein